MTSRPPVDALRLWEAGWGLPPLERAVVLAAASTGSSPDTVSSRPVGERDRLLYTLRARLFGTAIEAVSTCPGCAGEVELAFDLRHLLAGTGPSQPEVTVVAGGVERTFRTPTSVDVAAVLARPAAHDTDAAQVLLRRCRVASGVDGSAEDDAAGQDDEAADAVTRAWLVADPLADVTLELRCPECATEWAEPLDIGGFLWSELDNWCRAMLLDVHQLARAYGWSEAEILALSPWRRRCYLGLVGA
ncbi:MAG TPA: hypothetical protein VI248_17020 [Kineosporiaceae bacterium]